MTVTRFSFLDVVMYWLMYPMARVWCNFERRKSITTFVDWLPASRMFFRILFLPVPIGLFTSHLTLPTETSGVPWLAVSIKYTSLLK